MITPDCLHPTCKVVIIDILLRTLYSLIIISIFLTCYHVAKKGKMCLCGAPFLWGPLFGRTCWPCLNPPLRVLLTCCPCAHSPRDMQTPCRKRADHNRSDLHFIVINTTIQWVSWVVVCVHQNFIVLLSSSIRANRLVWSLLQICSPHVHAISDSNVTATLKAVA